MKWAIVGAGAIGGVLGAKLHQAGQQVGLVARGEHLAALRRDGLTLHDPAGKHRLPLPAVASPAELDLVDGDVVILAVKSQHTANALAELAVSAPSGIRLICAQNGIDNERQALRHFGTVYGACVTLLASYLQPGVVVAHSAPTVGILQLGGYPAGTDEFVATAAGILEKADLRVDVTDDVMRYKRLKLRGNLANAIEVICDGPAPGLVARLTAEADDCFAAAGLSLPAPEEDVPGPPPVDPSVPRAGGSTRQSILRSAGSVETDYLNGEIALLGRLHSVPTPVNALLQRLAAEVATGRRPANSLSPAQLAALVG